MLLVNAFGLIIQIAKDLWRIFALPSTPKCQPQTSSLLLVRQDPKHPLDPTVVPAENRRDRKDLEVEADQDQQHLPDQERMTILKV